MAHNYAINDDVHHQLQGPQGRAVVKQRSVYTIVTCLPIEADGRPRYRIKSKTDQPARLICRCCFHERFVASAGIACYSGSGGVNASHSNDRSALLNAPNRLHSPRHR